MTHRHSYTFIEPSGERIAGHRHKNPDGSVGGWVAKNATIAETAVIEPGAVVEPRATVLPDCRVPAGRTIRYRSLFPS